MLQFNFHNCMAEEIGEEHGLTEADLVQAMPRVEKAHQQIQAWRASGEAAFFDLVVHDQQLDHILNYARQVEKEFDDIVVLGIGGSSLGLGAMQHALLQLHHNSLSRNERGVPRLWICSNLDPDSFVPLMGTLDPRETLFIVISKSGKTTETLAQFFVVVEKLKACVGEHWKKHLAIITDPSHGPLRAFSAQEGIKSFPLPSQLGGRYSVLSPVGLFPAACVGMPIEDILDGAQSLARNWQNADTLEENPAYMLALLHVLLDEKKKKNNAVMFPYKDGLSTFADWYIQLWAESLGKKGKGSTPLKALGAIDQHSQLQLFMEGPNNKVFTFLGVDEFSSDPEETHVVSCIPGFDELNGHSFGEILQAEQSGTTQALTQAGRPNITITLPELNGFTLGQLFFTYELATAFAGALYGVNPFDQPGVELSKKLTKQILSGEH